MLVGPMGTGKTTIGKRLAERLGRAYVDNDEVLRARTGRSAAEMEDTDGLEALHAAEARVLLDVLAEERPSVITAASSTIESAEAREAMAARATVVWLDYPADALAEKLAKSPGDRPRLGNEPAAIKALVHDLARDRDPLFRAAADVIATRAGRDPEELVDEIAARLREL